MTKPIVKYNKIFFFQTLFSKKTNIYEMKYFIDGLYR